jgi:hypothetical protein
MKNALYPILLATLWISLSEFFRNEFLLKNQWVMHFEQMGQIFPAEPINGAIWGIWSLFLAIALYIFNLRYTWIQSALLGWFVGFVFMWLVIGNLGVLPLGILPVAIPLSILEVTLASWMIHWFKTKK